MYRTCTEQVQAALKHLYYSKLNKIKHFASEKFSWIKTFKFCDLCSNFRLPHYIRYSRPFLIHHTICLKPATSLFFTSGLTLQKCLLFVTFNYDPSPTIWYWKPILDKWINSIWARYFALENFSINQSGSWSRVVIDKNIACDVTENENYMRKYSVSWATWY